MFGDILRELRKQKGLSQEELSKLLKINRGTYAHYELNKRQPDFVTVKKLADFFGVPIDYLFGNLPQSKELVDQLPNIDISIENADAVAVAAFECLGRLRRENSISDNEYRLLFHLILHYVKFRNENE